jgi:hypothetical protein
MLVRSSADGIPRNATLNCDPDLYRMVGQIDNYLWSEDNVTTLCTPDCISDSSDWVANVEDVCLGQTYNVASKLVPVDTVAFRYVEGITLACLKSEYVYKCLHLEIQADLTRSLATCLSTILVTRMPTTQALSKTNSAILTLLLK